MAINHNKPQDQITPITPPQPDNITGNLNNNLKVQQLGKEMFQGEALAEQFAMRGLDNPVSPPGNPMGDQLGNMFMQPFANNNKAVEKKEKVQETLPTERVGAVRETPNKINKPREMPEQIIPPTNIIGSIKKAKDPNKGKAYVVNKRPNVWQEGTEDRSKDTLWLDNSYKKMAGSYIDQDEYDDLARKAYSEGSYKRVGVQDLEDGGEIKIKI
jgi:hypothetical protein